MNTTTMNQTARTVRADHWSIIAKKYAYLIALLPVTILLPGSYAGMYYLGYEDIWAFFSVFFVFGVIPVLDHLVGTDSINPDEKLDVPVMGQEKWYPFLTLIAVPLQIGSIFFGGSSYGFVLRIRNFWLSSKFRLHSSFRLAFEFLFYSGYHKRY